MFIRRSIFTALALSGLVTFAACGDHRAEDFCNSICQCISDGTEEGIAVCATDCTADITRAEEETGDERILTDACFSCVTTSSCQTLDNCESDCQSLSDVIIDDESVPETDPRPGDQ